LHGVFLLVGAGIVPLALDQNQQARRWLASNAVRLGALFAAGMRGERPVGSGPAPGDVSRETKTIIGGTYDHPAGKMSNFRRGLEPLGFPENREFNREFENFVDAEKRCRDDGMIVASAEAAVVFGTDIADDIIGLVLL